VSRRNRQSTRRDGMASVCQNVHKCGSQTFGVRHDGRERRIGRHGDAHVVMFGARRLLGVGAQPIDIRRRVLEPNRPREVEHVIDDAVEARDFFVHVRQRLRDVCAGCALVRKRAE